ncbi:MAG TPA: biopolymer transporter ExbD [Chitinispirillaceae bacterium]|nr:biopolymer transporter ExbD [Chitinispirillaceae bacterium]
MKLSFITRRTPSEAADAADLDVTPVMNMFVILIPFLVSMAVFTHLSIIEFSLPPNVSSAMANQTEKPHPRLTVRLGADYIGIVMGENLLDSLPVNGIEFPFDTLALRLKTRLLQLDYHEEIIIASTDKISFKYVVRVMDICRSAGFEKIGLSSAAEDTEADL